MRQRTNHTLNMLKSVACFIQQFPATLQYPVIAELYALIVATIAAIETAARNQVEGRGGAAGGAHTKRAKQEELRAYLKDVARIGRTLDPDLYPGLAAHFILPNSRGYAVLMASARDMINHATAHEAAFVARGLSTTFLAELNDLLADFKAATDARIDGMQTQVGGTSALHHEAARGIRAAQELDAIFRALFRNDPVTLDVWKHARHIQRDPSRATTEALAPTQTNLVVNPVPEDRSGSKGEGESSECEKACRRQPEERSGGDGNSFTFAAQLQPSRPDSVAEPTRAQL